MSNDLKSIHDFDFTMICNYFKLLERQGPGSPEVTQKAVSFINVNIHFCEIFLAENFVISIIIRIFAASVLAKPLNNAQIVRGVFYLYTFEYGKSYTFYKTI